MGGSSTRRQDVSETAVIQACAQCGDPIAPPRKFYCSGKCANLAYLERVAEAAAANNQTGDWANNQTFCQRCQRPIERGSRRPRLYCSAACQVASSKARRAAAREPSEWIPEPGANRAKHAIQRRKLIRKWAAEGYGSRQMAERLGMRDDGVRRIARESGIEITADSAMGKTRRMDSGRIVAETASALEGLAIGIGLVSLDELDPAQVQDWAASLTASIRDLDRFVKTMKENAQ